MKTIFVTGGGGFIASHTIEALKERGYHVITNIRGSDRPEYLEGVEVYSIDMRDRVGIRSLVEKCDGVINLAGILGTKNTKAWKAFYENNVFGAWGVMSACMQFNIPMIQIAVGNYFEHNLYSNTKTAVERDMLMNIKYNGLRGAVVRGLNAYGERQKIKNTGKIISTFIDLALNNKPLDVYGGKENCGIMDMIYVKDLANILVDVLELVEKEGGQTEVFEAGTGRGETVYDIAKIIVELTESDSTIRSVPMRSGESNRSIVIANKPYGYAYTSLEEGLKKTIDYYKSL